MSSIRINPDVLPDLLAALGKTRQQADTATLELATGSRINKPSDDPAGAAQLISNHDQASRADSFLRSISSATGLLQTADSTLGSVVAVLQRAISLGVQGANGTLSASDRNDIAQELARIQQQLIALGNTSYQGEFIFSGTSTVQPFVAGSASPSGVTYTGNPGVNSIQAGENYSIQINQPGSQIFTAPGADVFHAISDLIAALQSNTNTQSAVDNLRNAFDHVTSQRVFYGNALNQLQAQQTFLNSEKVDLATAENLIAGADLAKSITTLTQAQTAISAELAAMSKISQSSLFDYLK